MQSAIINLSYKQDIRASLGTISHASSYVRTSSESVCSEKMLDVVPLLRIVLQLFFRTLAIIPCTIVGYAVPVRGNLFFPCSYGFLISPPTIFGVRFSLLTLRFQRAACATSAVGASFHATALTARFWLGLFLFPSCEALLPPPRWRSTLAALRSSKNLLLFIYLCIQGLPYALMKLFLLCALMSSVFMTFGYYGFCSIFPLQS